MFLSNYLLHPLLMFLVLSFVHKFPSPDTHSPCSVVSLSLQKVDLSRSCEEALENLPAHFWSAHLLYQHLYNTPSLAHSSPLYIHTYVHTGRSLIMQHRPSCSLLLGHHLLYVLWTGCFNNSYTYIPLSLLLIIIIVDPVLSGCMQYMYHCVVCVCTRIQIYSHSRVFTYIYIHTYTLYVCM